MPTVCGGGQRAHGHGTTWGEVLVYSVGLLLLLVCAVSLGCIATGTSDVCIQREREREKERERLVLLPVHLMRRVHTVHDCRWYGVLHVEEGEGGVG